MAVKKKQTQKPKLLVAPHERAAGDAFEVSQSTLRTWRRCHNKYYYQYIELIEPRKPKLQLVRGEMLGKCFDAMAAIRMLPPKLRSKATPWQAALRPYEELYEKLFDQERELYGDPITEVKRIAGRYEIIYANDGFEYLSPPGSTQPFELPVQVDLAPGIVFTGHIDKMPRDKQGRVWDMDHKSHKRIPDADDRFHDLQQVFYQWAMPISGYPKPTGVIWDYVRTKPPTIPEELKKGGLTKRQNIDTDYETYMAEITRLKLNPKDYWEILNPLKARGHMDFYQRIQLPTPNSTLIETVVDEARTTAMEIKQRAGADRTRNMDRTCKQCSYQSICSAELRGLDAEFIRKTEYQPIKDPRHIHITREDD